jgi:predicted ATPase
VLVGINESGKTNLIKAVSLLDDEVEFSKDDIRDPGHDEDAVTESYVRFVFKVESSILNKIITSVKETFLASNLSIPLLDIGDKAFNLEKFCRYKDEVLYIINLLKESRSLSHWSISGPKYRIHHDWKKVKEGASHPFEHNGKSLNLSTYSVINTKDFDEIPEQFIEDLDILSLNKIVGKHLTTIVEEYLPACIVWNYSDDNLLPGRINLSQFISDPNTCVPLKNMFSLSGHHDVTKSLQDASQKTNGIRNILRKVSENTTSHMKKVWPEWKKQKVTLMQNGDFIEAGIEDEYNIYSLSRRSDGFKRFFTFLLMISVQNKTEEIYDNIIVIDEPDINLHPSGIQYLREELKKIGSHNVVLVSTHSIFMIDKEIIDRHLIVEKNKEITEIKRVDVSNINDEEVVYKALGYSLYELLKPKNIIFEGWRDKKYFEIFIRSKNGKKILPKENASRLGLLHAMGAKDISRVANTCENFSREYIIISDSDKPAQEKKRISLINKSIRYTFKENDIDYVVSLDNNIAYGKLEHLKKEINKLGIASISTNKLLNQIKEYSCLNAKASDFENKYIDVCKFIIKEIFA